MLGSVYAQSTITNFLIRFKTIFLRDFVSFSPFFVNLNLKIISLENLP